ncbi:MAG: branched-chain amino acid ABC transporter substrate-binding protein [Chloroflexota bacterium]|nr:branched-chain amino acid ABC transporter substrate-binding protein [Chloroflexota bacterium]
MNHPFNPLETANELRLAVVSPSATWPGLTKSGYGVGEPGLYYPNGERMFFRVVPSDDIQGRVAAEWLSDKNHTSICIVGQENPYSTGLTNLMLSNAEDFGITIAGNTIYDETTITDAEIQALVATIDQASVDAIYYPVVVIDSANSRTYDLLNALHASDPARPIMGGDGLIGGLRADNSPLTNVFATSFQIDLDQTPEIVEFVAAYEAKFDVTVTVSDYYAVATYEAVQVVLDAIARAGETPTRSSVLQALRDTESYQGILGQWSFDDNGDTTYTGFGVMTIENGAWVAP